MAYSKASGKAVLKYDKEHYKKTTVKIPLDVWENVQKCDRFKNANQFLNMLAWMELCGNVGHCTDFQVRLGGDGSARPKFKFDSEEMQKSFDDLRTDMISELKKIPMYPSDIDIHISIS